MELVKNEPITLNKAIALCNKYQHLKGNVVISGKGDFEVIDCITIAPHDKLNKMLFFKLYKEMKDAEKAITFYNDSQYDVILILRELVPIGDFYYKIYDLAEYLETSGTNIGINALQ